MEIEFKYTLTWIVNNPKQLDGDERLYWIEGSGHVRAYFI